MGAAGLTRTLADADDTLEKLCAENAQLREVVRQKDECIESMRELIRDFVYDDG